MKRVPEVVLMAEIRRLHNVGRWSFARIAEYV